jgi:hypothetical protein
MNIPPLFLLERHFDAMPGGEGKARKKPDLS